MSPIQITSLNRPWNEKLKSIKKMAQSKYPILLQGESGTGKEVFARYIHENSPQRSGPLVSVNCSALTESLIESELFGHQKGSFTGAHESRSGAFESARGGTLFLDEIGDLPLSLQPKLLRALENQEIKPLGSDKIKKTNVRIITATHKNLVENISAQKFRSDLFFRINVLNIKIPPLRERKEDILSLLNRFSVGKNLTFSDEVFSKLKSHKWPGNVRELKNFVARASAIYPDEMITEAHLYDLISYKEVESSPSFVPLTPIKNMEKEMIINALKKFSGNQRAASSHIGLPKSTFHDRLKKYHINVREFQNIG